jgi:hypothetical protein
VGHDMISQSLTPAQQITVDFYKAYNVPASWFVGVIDPITGGVEVIALGEDFIWSLRINPDGTADTSEATVGEFDTGLDI